MGEKNIGQLTIIIQEEVRDIVRVIVFCFFKGKVSLLSQQSPHFLLCEGIYIGIRGKIHYYRSKNCLYRNVAPF